MLLGAVLAALHRLGGRLVHVLLFLPAASCAIDSANTMRVSVVVWGYATEAPWAIQAAGSDGLRRFRIPSTVFDGFVGRNPSGNEAAVLPVGIPLGNGRLPRPGAPGQGILRSWALRIPK